ncbi:hypothetical protein BGZ57DRAFT_131080 [Hyaloscypha finlandica]|nr:hypothetical protein BGZ57DRAFT_131080 [Hyaloscypha finlandica]
MRTLRLRRRARQCLLAAAHVSRNSDDERGSLSRCSVSGTCAAALLPYQLPRWGNDWAAVTAAAPAAPHGPGSCILDSGHACLGRPPNTPNQHTVASCCSCAGPFGKRGGHSPAKSVSTAHRSWQQTDSDLSASSTTMVTGTAAVPRPLLVLGDTLTCVSFPFEPDSDCVDTFAALTPHHSLPRPSTSSMVSVPRSSDR